jgi:hypothetical protein
MQTFLPYSDFSKTAKCLDMKRLGKMRVEGMQILMTLTGLNKTNAWINHPAVKMWRGYELALAEYVYALCDEWTGKGYKDTCKEKVKNIIKTYHSDKPLIMPHWMGSEDFHEAHRSNLLRKNENWYINYFGDMPNDLPYIWPVERV